MYFPRTIKQSIIDHLEPNKVVRLYGPRRSGKSTLVKEILQGLPYKTIFINGEDATFHKYFIAQSYAAMQSVVGDCQLLVVDEAQAVPNIGMALKILVDTHPSIRVLVTGSSAIGLGRMLGEPLVGRSWTYRLHPLSYGEIHNADRQRLFGDRALENLLTYGSYPEVINTPGDLAKQDYLNDLKDNYLYKDITDLYIIEKPKLMGQLLTLLAYQIGSEVSLSELASKLQIDSKTVAKYLWLLEESFIIFHLGGFRRNLRNEVIKFGKYYFWDLGVRNALIGAYSSFDLRNDIGAVWENFLVSERRKLATQPGVSYHDYFWRLHSGTEIDYIETADGMINAWEFKWSNAKAAKTRVPKSWQVTYPEASFAVVSPGVIGDWLLPAPTGS